MRVRSPPPALKIKGFLRSEQGNGRSRFGLTATIDSHGLGNKRTQCAVGLRFRWEHPDLRATVRSVGTACSTVGSAGRAELVFGAIPKAAKIAAERRGST
jgi:hypothetical protein